MSMPPRKNAAPANWTVAEGLVNQANRLVINIGPIIFVKLIILVRPPCNSPCWLGGTWPEIIDCRAGPEMPPRQYGNKKTNIIQLWVANANKNSPMA